MKKVALAIVTIVMASPAFAGGKYGRGLMKGVIENEGKRAKFMRLVDPRVTGSRAQLILNREFSSELDGFGDLFLFHKNFGKTRAIEKSLYESDASDIKEALENALHAATREDVIALRIRNLDKEATELVVKVSPAFHGGRIDRVITIDTINMDTNMNKQIIERSRTAENVAQLRRLEMVEGKTENSIVIKKFRTGAADEQDQLEVISQIIAARNNIHWLENLRGRAPRAELTRPPEGSK